MALLLGPEEWDRFHKAAVFTALEETLAAQAELGHPFAIHADLFAGYESIMEGKVKAVIAEDYLIVYDVGPTVFTNKSILFENLVVKLGKFPGRITAVPEALDQLARKHNCVAIASGNSVGRRGLSRVYERAGFKPLSTQFYKEVT